MRSNVIWRSPAKSGSPEIARRDAEGMEHHVSEETLDAFRLFTQKHGAK